MRKFFAFLSLCTIVLGSFFSVTPVFAGTNIQLSPTTIDVKEGELFDLTVDVVPPGVKSYTVRLVLEFPSELVNVKTWAYEPKWIPIRKSGYDVLNNDQGVFIRTAGYPMGFDSIMNFGKVTFVAKKSGVASIRISNESLVFDKNSNNIATLSGPVSVKISAVSVPKPEVVPVAPKTLPDSEVKSVEEKVISPNFLPDQKTSTSTEEINFVTSTTSTSATSTEQISPVAVSSEHEESEKITSVAAPAQKVTSEPTASQTDHDNVIYFLIVALVMDLVAISMGVRSKVRQPQHSYQSK